MARLAAAAVALLLLGGCAQAALLTRPEQDCINPSVNKVNEFNFFPEDFRSTISAPQATTPGTTVRRPGQRKTRDYVEFDYNLDPIISILANPGP